MVSLCIDYKHNNKKGKEKNTVIKIAIDNYASNSPKILEIILLRIIIKM